MEQLRSIWFYCNEHNYTFVHCMNVTFFVKLKNEQKKEIIYFRMQKINK